MQPIKLFTLYTEDVDRENTLALLDIYFDSYTIVPAIGRWKRYEEKALVIQIITFDRSAVYIAAHAIKERRNQDSVLVTEQPITHNVI